MKSIIVSGIRKECKKLKKTISHRLKSAHWLPLWRWRAKKPMKSHASPEYTSIAWKKACLFRLIPPWYLPLATSIRRVLDKHKKIESPYNTYLNPGLPPGPICLPEISSLDAVLNYEKHDYYFFCAKPDYSGYHNFSKTYAQHRQYAALYRRFLNSEGIYR